jgi:hypothetical protein
VRDARAARGVPPCRRARRGRTRAASHVTSSRASPRSHARSRLSFSDRSRRSPASTISIFCCAVQLRYFLGSLVPAGCKRSGWAWQQWATFSVRSGSLGRSGAWRTWLNQAFLPNSGEPARTVAPTRQAGGHWFDPRTAHSPFQLNHADLRGRTSRLLRSFRRACGRASRRPS